MKRTLRALSCRAALGLSAWGGAWGCSLGPVEDLPITGGDSPPNLAEDGEASGDDGLAPSPEQPVDAGAGGGGTSDDGSSGDAAGGTSAGGSSF